ncbi:MAG: thiamine-binding protein [Deltaproteobacteria bacterium]|nr:thiamine-binding protein [Deltaproteobacteria bacterium]
MLFELNIISSGQTSQKKGEIAEAMKMLDGSGFHYLLTPSGACIEGDWEEVMTLIAQCHDHRREPSSHVITKVKVENDRDGRNRLTLNVQSVAADGKLEYAPLVL